VGTEGVGESGGGFPPGALMLFLALACLCGCPSPAPSRPDERKSPVPLRSGQTLRYAWGPLLAGTSGLGEAPVKWRQGKPWSMALSLSSSSATLPMLRAGSVAAIVSDGFLRLPSSPVSLLGGLSTRAKPLPGGGVGPERVVYEGRFDPISLVLRTDRNALVALAPELDEGSSLALVPDLAVIDSAVLAAPGSSSLARLEMLGAEGVAGFLRLFLGPEEAANDRPRFNLIIGLALLRRGSELGLQVLIDRSLPGMKAPLREQILLHPMPLSDSGPLRLALLIAGPFVGRRDSRRRLVLTIQAEPGSWRTLGPELRRCGADLARQRSVQAVLARPATRPKTIGGYLDLAAVMESELRADIEALGLRVPKPGIAANLKALQTLCESGKNGFPRRARALLARSFGDAARPRDREGIALTRHWLAELQGASSKLGRTIWMRRIVQANRRALGSRQSDRRWRAFAWFRRWFPELPKGGLRFVLSPSPRLCRVVDGVLASHGLRRRAEGS